MAADIFNIIDCHKLFHNKRVLFFGDSNMRAIYKDVVWLLETSTLIPAGALRTKNEKSHANDVRISDGQLTKSRNYAEIRVYDRNNVYIRFEFLTRLFSPNFLNTLQDLPALPDAIVMNSCLWDLSRWGANGVQDFKVNLMKTLNFLKAKFTSSTKIIWTTTLPPSFKSRGGFLTRDIDFLKTLLPFHIIEANNFAADLVKSFEFDVMDLYYHMRFLIDMRGRDGIHWEPKPLRYITNLILTHLCLSWGEELPGNVHLDENFLHRSHNTTLRRLSDVGNAATWNERFKTKSDRVGKVKKKQWKKNHAQWITLYKCFQNFHCNKQRSNNRDFKDY